MLGLCSCCGEAIAGGHVVQMNGALFCSMPCAEKHLEGPPLPKMSPAEKRRAKLCMADGCDAAAKHYMGNTNEVFCAEHYLPHVEKWFRDSNERLGKLCYDINPHYDAGGRGWDGVVDHCAAYVGKLKADNDNLRAEIRHHYDRRKEAEKRIAMLEAERGPGMKPEPAPITCDVGAYYDE